MKKHTIIVAGGSGTRMQSTIPKQFLELNGKPILLHTLQQFYNYDNAINVILVLPKEHFKTWEKIKNEYSITIPHQTVEGGETRYHSVKNGLTKIEEDGLVAVHDAVRCLVSKNVITACFKIAKNNNSAIPVIPVSDSLRKGSFELNKAVNRNEYFSVQTPQVFATKMIKAAYELPYSNNFTDDASVVEAANYSIKLCEGDKENIKVTTPFDLTVAELILKNR